MTMTSMLKRRNHGESSLSFMSVVYYELKCFSSPRKSPTKAKFVVADDDEEDSAPPYVYACPIRRHILTSFPVPRRPRRKLLVRQTGKKSMFPSLRKCSTSSLCADI